MLVGLVVEARVALDFERRVLDAERRSASMRLSSPARSCASCRLSGPPSTTCADSAACSLPGRPQVEMVHGLDARLRRERVAHRARRRGSAGTASRSTRPASRRSCHAAAITSSGDQDRRRRVEPVGAEERDADAGDDHADRAERVAEQVPERAAHVEVAVRVPEQRARARRRSRAARSRRRRSRPTR